MVLIVLHGIVCYDMVWYCIVYYAMVCNNLHISVARRYVNKSIFLRAALEREKQMNYELEKKRLSAEEENARQRERSRQIEREKHLISRELNQRENENEYLVCNNVKLAEFLY